VDLSDPSRPRPHRKPCGDSRSGAGWELITTFLGLGILSLQYQIDLDRIFFLNLGQSLDLGDRGLTAFRPPVYNSPATTGFYDLRTGTCFTSDCFGFPVASVDQAGVDDVSELPADDLLAGQLLWAPSIAPG
jgi:flavorubredoxin